MHVLLTEALFGDADPLADRLRAIGCQVSRCHQGSGICQALVPAGRCPLDARDPVDLIVDVRGQTAELTAREFGVVCGLRAGIPIVLVPAGGSRPAVPPGLERRVSVVTEAELIDSCVTAMNIRRARPGMPTLLSTGN